MQTAVEMIETSNGMALARVMEQRKMFRTAITEHAICTHKAALADTEADLLFMHITTVVHAARYRADAAHMLKRS